MSKTFLTLLMSLLFFAAFPLSKAEALKLVTYEHEGRTRIGAVVDDRVIDLNSAYVALLQQRGDPRPVAMANAIVPPDMVEFLDGEERSMKAAREAVAFAQGLFFCRRLRSHTQVANSTGGIMNLSEYKDYLTGAIAVEANFTSDETARRAFETLVEHLREMDMNEQYMQDAWRGHGELPDDAQRKDALRTALAEYRSYDKAEQLSTVFLIDLVHVARPQEGFV